MTRRIIGWDQSYHWSSDWNGDEVGYPEIDVVGLYTKENAEGKVENLYVNTENGHVLESWFDDEEEEF